MNVDAPKDLRTRRRLDTQQEIHEAALALFEAQGVRETTIQQIADRAGVSARTFFRHFSSKEQAALPGQRRMLKVIDTLEVSDRDPGAVLRSVEKAAEISMRAEDPELIEHRQVAALLAREPDLRALAAAQEQVLTARLRTRLAEQLDGYDPLTLLLIAEVAAAAWRTFWQRLGELGVEGEAGDPAELYRRCVAELRRVVG